MASQNKLETVVLAAKPASTLGSVGSPGNRHMGGWSSERLNRSYWRGSVSEPPEPHELPFPIDPAPMPDGEDRHNLGRVVDRIDHAVVPNP